MTATGAGFVQRHEQQALEGTLCQRIDEYLDRTYGKAKERISPGLKWLTGNSYEINAEYLDHPEYRVKDGRKTMIGRPYGIRMSGIETALKLAKAKGIDLFIDAPSNYTLDTVLVIFTEK